MSLSAKLQLIMILVLAASWGCSGVQKSGSEEVGAVLPFEPPPMAGTIGDTMQESVHKWRTQPRLLPEDVDKWNKRYLSPSPGIAVTAPSSDKVQYINFPGFSNAILLQVCSK
jgi:hypothetical protein